MAIALRKRSLEEIWQALELNSFREFTGDTVDRILKGEKPAAPLRNTSAAVDEAELGQPPSTIITAWIPHDF
jgi:hypothetical protein